MAALLLASGCSNKPTAPGTLYILDRVEVVSSGSSLSINQGRRLAAVAYYVNVEEGEDVSDLAQWTTTTPSVAVVDAQGVVVGIAEGTAEITATYSGLAGSKTLTVASKSLTGISVTPAGATMVPGTNARFSATGIYSDGTTEALLYGKDFALTSGTPSVATVGGYGTVSAVSAGSCAITATSGKVSGSTPLEVSSSPLVSIEVTPGAATVRRGQTTGFAATGRLADGTRVDLTGAATWTAGTRAIASVYTIPPGTVGGTAPGSSLITATFQGVSGSAELAVLDAATLQSITVSPPTAELSPQGTQQFAATGHYSDGTTSDLTLSATWSSSEPEIASVTASGGLARGIQQGAAVITAVSGAAAGSATLAVQGVAGFSLAVSPSEVSLSAGGPTAQALIMPRRAGGFADPIELSVDPPDPGIGASLSTSHIAEAGVTSELTVSAASGTKPGRYLVGVRGKATGLPDALIVLAVTVASAAGRFTLLVVPASIAVDVGATGSTAGVSIQRIEPFDLPVTLSVEGLPPGLEVTITPNPLALGYAAASILVSATRDAVAGTYAATVRASGQGAADQTMLLTVIVKGTPTTFALAVDSTTVQVFQDSSQSTAVRIRRTNFTGPVSLAATPAVSGLDVAFSPNPVTSSDQVSTLTVRAGDALSLGTYPLTITASSQGYPEQRADFAVIVAWRPRGFTLHLDPDTTLYVGPGRTVSYTLVATRYDPVGAIALSAPEVPAIWPLAIAFSQDTIPADDSTATVLVTAPVNGPGAVTPLFFTVVGTAANGRDTYNYPFGSVLFVP